LWQNHDRVLATRVSVEMAKSIATNETPEEVFHAVLMGVGRVSPEVVLYSATAEFDYSPKSKRRKRNDEEEET